MGNILKSFQNSDKLDEPELRRQEDSDFTCEICIEPMPSIRKFKNAGLCTHPFCLDCISKYVEVKVESVIGRIDCPGLDCKNQLDPFSCMPVISRLLFEKWSDLLCESLVLGLESCYCPYQDCSALVLNECENKLKKTKCPNCKKNFCFRCKIQWHAGYKCSESRHLRDRNDILAGELIEEKKWTRCYNCGHSVERISGCREIKCKCGVRFCYKCGGRFHLGPCKYKFCGDGLVLLLFLALLAVLGYFVFHRRNYQLSYT